MVKKGKLYNCCTICDSGKGTWWFHFVTVRRGLEQQKSKIRRNTAHIQEPSENISMNNSDVKDVNDGDYFMTIGRVD